MKISKGTQKILSEYTLINPGIIIEKGNRLISRSVDCSILSTVIVPETFEEEISLYNLSQFLNIISCFGEPDLKIDSDKILISEGKQKFTYFMTNKDLIKEQANKLLKAEPEYDTTFILTSDNINKLFGVMRVMNFDSIGILTRNNKLYLSVYDKANGKDQNSFEIEISDYDGEEDFFYILSKKNFVINKSFDYKVSISKIGCCKFEALDTKDYEGLTYWIGFVIDD